jgi:hypothetical protein
MHPTDLDACTENELIQFSYLPKSFALEQTNETSKNLPLNHNKWTWGHVSKCWYSINLYMYCSDGVKLQQRTFVLKTYID